MDLAHRAARSFQSRKFTDDDFRSMAYIGLCEAADSYQPDKGPFRPYAYYRIYGSIVDQLRLINGRRFQKTRLVLNQQKVDDLQSNRNEMAQFEAREYLEKTLPNLSKRELRVLKMIYIDGLTLEDIGPMEGVDPSRISQIKTVALKKLRRKGDKV